MTATYQSVGLLGAGGSGVNLNMPPSLADGDLVLLMVVTKPDTATVVTPTNWTLITDVAGGGGTTGPAVGPTRQAWFYRVKDPSWASVPALAVTGANSTATMSVRVSPTAGGTWDVAAATGTYGDAGVVANGAATLSSDPGIAADDLLLCGYSSMSVAPTWSAQAITAPGVTIGAATERSEAIETLTGDDVGGMLFTASATAGTSTGAPSTAATASTSTRGTVALVRVREAVAPPPPPPSPIVDGQARITRIAHRITGGKWLVTLGFTVEGGIAQPQVTPSPTPSGGKTLSQLLRPVGEVTMWYGAAADVPAPWLLCDGTAIPADYPDLIALIGANTPNMVDVFPIGAGTKAKGTTGGDPTKVIAETNLPAHGHGYARRASATGFGTAASAAAPSGTGTLETGNTNPTGGGTPLDVMPPWRALHFIIRAR